MAKPIRLFNRWNERVHAWVEWALITENKISNNANIKHIQFVDIENYTWYIQQAISRMLHFSNLIKRKRGEY